MDSTAPQTQPAAEPRGSRALATSLASDVASARHACFVGRQPIYDRRLEVIAYEVLFRRGAVAQADVLDGDHATAQVLLNTFLEIGLDAVVGQQRAFINCTRGMLLQDMVQVFPPERVGIEVLEDIVVDSDLLVAVRGLATQGYLIALDDFHYQDALRPLLELADVVKLDICALDRPRLDEHVTLLRAYDVKLLAEKVETHDDFQYCKDLGFDYFQGYFFCRPDLITGRRTPLNRLALLQLLAELQRPEVEFRTLEALCSRDAALSYKLLRIINSAFYGLPRKVESIRHALHLLGLKTLTTWASLLLLARIDTKPHELLRTAMVRAKMCEQLGQAMGQDGSETFFLVGLFSVLDALLDHPLPEVLAALPLADAISQALLHHEGVLGATLRCVLAYERGTWEEVHDLGLAPEVLMHAYLAAIAWTTATSAALPQD